MRIALTGSIATDHLMHFPARFADQLQAANLNHVSLSFLVDELVVRRGGVAANIAFGMGQLGLHPLLVGAVGVDFADYRTWLEQHDVDCSGVRTSRTAHTARFVCTTDEDMNQIGSFYAGAMSEARDIELAPLAAQPGGLDLLLVSANDPAAMVRHTTECRELGLPFAADPGQQLARLDGEQIDTLIDGAAYLLTNEYERSLLDSKTVASDRNVLDRVGVRVTTLGSRGVRLEGNGIDTIDVPVATERCRQDPTGVGDGFRAGFFAGLSWGLPLERSAQVGSMLATYIIETVGTQEYFLRAPDFVDRLRESYGDAAADDVAPHLL